MRDACAGTGFAQPGFQLDCATRIRRRNDCRLRFGDVREFSQQQLPRHLRLRDVVDAGAPAAPHRLRQFHELGIAGAQHLAGGMGNLLAVAKVTSLVVGHAQRLAPSRFLQFVPGQPFMHVLEFRRPLGRARRVGGIAVQQMAIVF